MGPVAVLHAAYIVGVAENTTKIAHSMYINIFPKQQLDQHI